jgi:hypothetical protein
MTTPTPDPYPGSFYLQISPILSDVFADIQGRMVQYPAFAPEMTELPPSDPGRAYSLSIFSRQAHVVFKRWSPNGNMEFLFGTGGFAGSPKVVQGAIVVPSTYTGLISLLTVTWMTMILGKYNLTPWNLARIKLYYPDIVNNPQYNNLLRTFCHNVLGIAEDSFTSSTNNVGYATDYDDQ